MNKSIIQFDPPYDSPIQQELAWVLSKYVTPNARFTKEKEISTDVSAFRVDLVLEIPGGKSIGIECDGRDFHDPLADLFRDSLILGSSNLSALYRFPGRVLANRPEDALYLLSLWEPEFFNDRLDDQRDLLVSDEVRDAFNQGAWHDAYPYVFNWNYRVGDNGLSQVEVVRHKFGLREPPPDSIDRIWAFSQAGSFCSVDALAEAFASKHPTREWRGWVYYSNRKSQLFSNLDAKYFKHRA
jgi:hypothetical protein